MTTGGKGTPFLIGLAAGGAIGAALMFLLAPRVAAEVRDRVNETAEEIRRKARAARDKACEVAARVAKECEGGADATPH
jgi:gas vesicle protein